MRIIAINCSTVQKRRLKLFALFTFLCCGFFSSTILAQSITFPTSCTSKDLTLLSASLPAPANNRCQCSGDRKLVLGIRNGTGSFRTSFALWGTLVRKNSTGDIIETKQLFACAAGIQPKSDNFLNATTIKLNGVDVANGSVDGITLPVLHIECGESLDITDMHLAWTSASPGETCDVLYASPSTINPKCGTQDLIHVGLGVNAVLTVANASCTAGGSIKVEPNGGIAPYQVCLYKKNSATDSTLISTCRNVAAGGSTTFGSLAEGTYTVKTTDNMNETDATKRCFINLPVTITQPDAVTDPVVSVTDPTCTVSTGKIQITSTTTGLKFKLDNGSFEDYPAGGYTVASGNHTITCQKGTCTSNAVPANVGNAPANPTFTVCITQPTLCDKGSLTITASGGSNFMYRINGTSFTNATKTNSTGIFTDLVTGDVTYVQVKNGDGCASTAVACSSLTSVCGGGVTKKVQQEPAKISNEPAVKAYPNPFSDRVKFVLTSSVSGNGTLEVYNIMGQKVKTVYRGHIKAGEQSFDLTIPKKQQSTLIYVFRVGDKKVTGKLLQMNQ